MPICNPRKTRTRVALFKQQMSSTEIVVFLTEEAIHKRPDVSLTPPCLNKLGTDPYFSKFGTGPYFMQQFQLSNMGAKLGPVPDF